MKPLRCNAKWIASIQGLVVSEIRKMQEKFYKASNSPIKYNGVRWMKHVMRSSLGFCHDMWTERCAIVVAGTNEIHERRMRLTAWQKLQDVRRDQWKIPAVCRDLLRRDKKFFRKAPYLQIEMWISLWIQR